ncbi:MAG: Arginine-tRNA ligase [Parcubacteria group bacterium GW2011_GWC1_35_8]|uniref:Arginine--tRNA ligase n=3 Tax=Candidatus Nomuraibacteriota TaxID=1752729 RepID=A0A1F6YRA9_9BACT|nr:MAG: Arginine-tRNA ligase [Parcubacteria group bacterium GW2011_GWC1_35_8]KKP87851.1 MAG: Arginine-tRNA ligase [Candidatus Nomurabacteria bacterium GW2011_GWC2_35_8]OGJ05561.1 MAG: arginine--tRNA ligase [Candidatus Nomurabacteria bacterium RIFOXYA1_FULL_35_17]OGJ06005.1 MAG: arginine--tRNA ligase [Candidatus Nomurabacteria bacterium RIFOXYA2_FULL_35_9]OGJ08914.1 MAG: arginine--tRNA ligase [Candidatus Nomurabacteria bacterium RIFOXYC2_FULL_36_19]OGJ14475.1 MAG: arginine--tRNA ligase [Candida
MQEKIKKLIKDALENLEIETNDIVLEHPADLKMGDYSTNVAMAVAKSVKSNPKELAEKIVAEILRLNLDNNIEKVEVAGPGFINFHLSRKFFGRSVEEILNEGENVGKNKTLSGKKIMIEHTVPNPFKPFHIGHLMTNAIGESVGRILKHSGAEVSQDNYQGDVGLHVAKAIYGLLENENLQSKIGTHNLQATNIGLAYARGAGAYEVDEKAKKEIDEINKKLYSKSDKKINEIYDWGFEVTMDAFEDLYKILGTKFDFYFLESVMADIGRDIVKDNMGKVFEESEGAIVFKAEKYDKKLHTRVFITKEGLPTYEAKELGLTEEKFKTEPDMDLSIVVTANEQADYMKVVAKAISIIHPEHEEKMKHITHGMMRLSTGKMGSRKGNAITGESLINDVRDAILEKMTDRDFGNEEREKIANDVCVSAIKYSILRSSSGSDIVYNVEESISTEGDSGPYLQYSFARANSVLEKAKKEDILPDPHAFPDEIFEVEKLLYKFSEVVLRASKEYEPHYIASYLIEVARAFNSFYGNNLIIDKTDKSSAYKVALTFAFSFVMKAGLHLLGIQAPERM